AARLSRGQSLPTGPALDRPHTTMILAAEDSAADTLRPRAEAAGADLEYIWDATAGSAPLQFPNDLAAIGQFLDRNAPDLIVIDPVVAYFPTAVAVNSDQGIREVLARLAELAGRYDCAILMIRHLRKAASRMAIHRGSGSIGFIASVRSGLLAGRHPSDPEQWVLTSTKSNYAGEVPSLGYRIRPAPNGQGVIEWTGPVEVDANSLGEIEGPLRIRDRASGWLQSLLAGGPRKAAEVLAAAAEAGIPDRTLMRAKSEMNISSHQLGRKGGEKEWYWYDSTVPWPKDAPFKKPYELPPLEDCL
ncbi:MAG TPA: AAA family ATPase, partial [Urbifossiella sp.]|nr:AAA family ATPase [Urbifossiella sp.]